jgi:thiol:disulfide interchange protein
MRRVHSLQEGSVIHYRHDDGIHHTHGGPQVAAACFAILIPVVLLLPLVRVAYDGQGAGSNTLFLLRPGGGFNVFALVLLLVPLIGIAVEMMQRPFWDIAAIVIALVGALMVPLAIWMVSRASHAALGPAVSVRPAMGAYALCIAYLALAVAVAVESWLLRTHHSRYTRDTHETHDAHLGTASRT